MTLWTLVTSPRAPSSGQKWQFVQHMQNWCHTRQTQLNLAFSANLQVLKIQTQMAIIPKFSSKHCSTVAQKYIFSCRGKKRSLYWGRKTSHFSSAFHLFCYCVCHRMNTVILFEMKEKTASTVQLFCLQRNVVDRLKCAPCHFFVLQICSASFYHCIPMQCIHNEKINR